MNQEILKRHLLINDYGQWLDSANYQLVELNMVEPYEADDKVYHPSTIVFENKQQMYMIRSDWTRSLLKYNQAYHSNQRFYGYVGPIVRDYQTFYQAGVEIYKASTQEMINCFILHMNFIKERMHKKLDRLVVNNDHLLQLYIEKYGIDKSLISLIYEKNISSLKEKLGKDHPLVALMSVKVSDQYLLVEREFGGHPYMEMIQQLKDKLKEEEIKLSLDLSFRSPQDYYNGFYFQLFTDEQTAIMSGGYYNGDAFGIGLNLTGGVD